MMMNPWFLMRMGAAGLSAALFVACAASRSRSQHDFQARHSAVAVERMQEMQRCDTLRSLCRSRETMSVCESRIETCDTVAAARAVLVVPLAGVHALPSGAGFAVREGRLSVSAQRRGDTLVVEARSDSMLRAVTRVERREIFSRRKCDSTVSAGHVGQTVYAADSAAWEEVRAEAAMTRVVRPFRWGVWLAVGAAAGVLLFVLLRRRR